MFAKATFIYTTYEATYDLKSTGSEIFAKNRSTKRCKFLRIFAELQWSITHSMFNESLKNIYTTFLFIRQTFSVLF